MNKKSIRGLFFVVATFLALPALSYTSSDGVDYTAKVNEHGAVLEGKNGDLLYLGKSCDAFSPTMGKGSWSWANGGFCVNLPSQRLCFARQDTPVELDSPSDCLM